MAFSMEWHHGIDVDIVRQIGRSHAVQTGHDMEAYLGWTKSCCHLVPKQHLKLSVTKVEAFPQGYQAVLWYPAAKA